MQASTGGWCCDRRRSCPPQQHVGLSTAKQTPQSFPHLLEHHPGAVLRLRLLPRLRLALGHYVALAAAGRCRRLLAVKDIPARRGCPGVEARCEQARVSSAAGRLVQSWIGSGASKGQRGEDRRNAWWQPAQHSVPFARPTLLAAHCYAAGGSGGSPDGDAVAPPQLARDAPVLDVLQPEVVDLQRVWFVVLQAIK